MENTKVKGIVLFSRDYQENDKLLNILTLELGKITVRAKGVRTQKSKLKMYTQSFCFAEFEIVKKQDFYVLTGVNPIDNFFNIVSDINKFESGFKIMEILDKTCKVGQTYVELFVQALKVLKTLNYSSINADMLVIKFLLSLFDIEGFGLNFDRCPRCKTKFIGKIYFDLDEGIITCENCKGENSLLITPAVFNATRLIKNAEYELLSNIKLKPEIIVSALNLLVLNFEKRFMCKLKSAKL